MSDWNTYILNKMFVPNLLLDKLTFFVVVNKVRTIVEFINKWKLFDNGVFVQKGNANIKPTLAEPEHKIWMRLIVQK